MEAILTNIGILLNIASTTDDGRKAIADLSRALDTFKGASPATEAVTEPTGPAAPAVQPAQPEPPKRKLPDDFKFSTVGYISLLDIANNIEKCNKEILAENDIKEKQNKVVNLYVYINYHNPGILIYEKRKTELINNLSKYIEEFGKAGLNNYTLQTILEDLQSDDTSFIKYSWFDDDGKRCAIVKKYNGSFREIRRGDLTGKELTAAGPRRWANDKELREFWKKNGYIKSTIGTRLG